MPRPTLALFPLALLLLAPSVRAQVDLPREHVSKVSRPGVEPAPLPRGDLAERVAGKSLGAQGSTSQGGLDLPDKAAPKAKAKPKPDAPAAPPPAPGGSEPAAPARPTAPAPASASAAKSEARAATALDAPPEARFILEEVKKLKDASHALIAHAVESLVAMGPPGLAAARIALAQDHGPLVIVGERVLLSAGDANDRASVLQRLRMRLPNDVCALAVDALVELDPVTASPRQLAELLSHPQSGVRAAAQRHLASRRSPELIEPLGVALRSNLTDARLRAVQLLEGIDAPAVMPLLLERLKDKSAEVAGRAIMSLAALEDERLDAELLRRSFGLQWVLREQSLALLVLLEREDRSSKPILGEMYVEPLLEGLGSGDAFVSGSCAAALAGIGFRSEQDAQLAWLDRDVPHRLVRIVGGEDFVEDLTVLLPIATRRLALVTGRNFGSDGPAWIAWWTSTAPTFVARRAVLPAKPDDATRLRLSFVSSVGAPQAFRLLGPDVGPAFDTPSSPGASDDLGLSESLVLSRGQARELFELCRGEGLFGAQRLPGSRGVLPAGGARTLEVAIGVRAKSFRFGGEAEPWFEHVVEAARSLRERSRWQTFFDGERTSGNAAWLAELAWWEAEHTELERLRREKELILRALPARTRTPRDEAVAELLHLSETPGVLDPLDFQAVLACMKQENFLAQRSRALLELARRCATKQDASGAHTLEPALAGDLLRALIDTFGPSAAPEASDLLRASGPEATRAAAASEQPFLRAIAAATLAGGTESEASASAPPNDDELALLMRLLKDPVPEVEAAAVLALGDHKVEAARTELLVRARLGAQPVRCAALVAIGKLGGDDVHDALLIGLADRDAAVVTSAARGLALSGDSSAPAMLIALLGKDRDSSSYQAAREGLEKLGPAAKDELLRVVRSPGSSAKREAALLLSHQGESEAAPALIAIAVANPGDAEVASELSVLTGEDFRSESDPGAAWKRWWQLVVHDDALAWWRGALERRGLQPPPPESFQGAGTKDGARFLVKLLAREEPYLVERARRELARLLGRDLGAAPLPGRDRAQWIDALSAEVERRWN